MTGHPQYLGHADFYSPSDVSWSYSDYLQAREFSDSIRYEISGQTKNLITNQNEIANSQICALERVEESNREMSFEVVHSVTNLAAINAVGFEQVGSVLDYGFQKLISKTDRTNDLLEDLLQHTKTPSQTWAYEQFDKARDEYRRGLFEEAIQSLEYAINGNGQQIGYKTEYRFHFLAGLIRLGGYKNNSNEIISLESAEEHFKSACRYAEYDLPEEAAKSLLFAARAASLQNKNGDVSRYARKGLKLHELAGLYYELAKAELASGKEKEAFENLVEALRMDKNLVLKAAGEGTFSNKPDFVNRVLDFLLDEVGDVLSRTREWIVADIETLENLEVDSKPIETTFVFKRMCPEQLSLAKKWASQADHLLESGGLLDIWEFLESLPATHATIRDADGQFRILIRENLKSRIQKIGDNKNNDVNDETIRQDEIIRNINATPARAGWGCFIFSVIAMFVSCTSAQYGATFAWFFAGLIGAPVFYFIVSLISESIAKRKRLESFEAQEAIESAADEFVMLLKKEEYKFANNSLYIPSKDVGSLLPLWLSKNTTWKSR